MTVNMIYKFLSCQLMAMISNVSSSGQNMMAFFGCRSMLYLPILMNYRNLRDFGSPSNFARSAFDHQANRCLTRSDIPQGPCAVLEYSNKPNRL